ncbi:MBL fold metallo-hydrolase [Candidatus Litorirhabdus singularis]|nr:MBL fold metallo-hydrolase [Candidatus Litorirhabdus singularis]
MRTPLYKSRPVGPHSARFGGERINDFIVMSEGNSNTYLLETPAGNILINSGMGYEAPVHAANFQALGNGAAIKYLITTQGHVDHVGGVQYFRDQHPGLQYIAQANNPEHQEYDARLQAFRGQRSAFRFMEAFKQDFAYYAEQGYTGINAQDTPTADILFEERHELSLGGLDLVLIAAAGAETNDSLIVWLPQHRIVLTGNLFGCPFGHFPNLVTIRGDRYRDALTCAAAADSVLELNAEMLLYGHHEPVVGGTLIRSEISTYRDAIHYVHDEVVKGMNAGEPLHQLQQDIQLPAELEVGQGYGKVSWSIRAIWENYAGWFKHESTTELYSVPPTAVYADLLELAGAGPLLDKAREKLAAGLLEESLHLLDILLSVQADNTEAKELAVAVHQALLESADNFWLNGWLENQIKLLQGGSTAPLAFK